MVTHDGARDMRDALLVIVVWPDGSTDLNCRVRGRGGMPDRRWVVQTLHALLAAVKAGRTL